MPPDASLAIYAPESGKQRRVRTSGQDSSTYLSSSRADGSYLHSFELSQGPVTKKFENPGGLLTVPLDTPVGRSWAWDVVSTDGRTAMHSEFRVLGTDVMSVGDQQIATVHIAFHVSTTGELKSTTNGTRWASQRLHLTVREEKKSNADYDGLHFLVDTKEWLVSTRPS